MTGMTAPGTGGKVRSPRVGIYRTRYAGDILLLVPLLNKIRLAYPEVFLFIVANEGTEDPIRRMEIPHLPFRGGNLFRKMKSVREVLEYVRRDRFDYWFDMTVSDRSRYVSKRVVADRTVGTGWASDRKADDPYDLYIPFDYDRGPEHIVSFQERVVQSAGLDLPVGSPDFSYPMEPGILEKVERHLESFRFPSAPILVIHPGGRHWFKCWPPDRFGRFANWWGQVTGGGVLLAGTRSEDTLLDSVGAAIGPKVRWAKIQESLSFLRAVLAKSSFFIGNDSAPMHLARSVDIPGIALFGSTLPSVWGPIGTDRLRILYKAVECSPCRHIGCSLGNANCLREIPVEEAIRAATELMSRFGSARE